MSDVATTGSESRYEGWMGSFLAEKSLGIVHGNISSCSSVVRVSETMFPPPTVALVRVPSWCTRPYSSEQDWSMKLHVR